MYWKQLSTRRDVWTVVLACLVIHGIVQVDCQPEADRAAQQDDADKLFSLWRISQSKSPLKKYLTEPLNKLKMRTTIYGGILTDCIRCALHGYSESGIYASDPDAYAVFSDVFDPVIKDYYKLPKISPQPDPDFGDLNSLGFGDLDPSGKIVKSTTIKVVRNHATHSFPPLTTTQDLIVMEKMAADALSTLRGELQGTYYSLTGMETSVHEQMKTDHFMFSDDNPVIAAANGYPEWPAGRGIYVSNDKKFLTWVNEADHMNIVSMEKDGNLARAWRRLAKGITELEKKLTFARDMTYGYLTFSPTNLGTALRASVHMDIPNLSQQKNFKKICEQLNLRARGFHGDHPETVDGVYEISNIHQLGYTEIEVIRELRDGVEEIIEREKKLQKGSSI